MTDPINDTVDAMAQSEEWGPLLRQRTAAEGLAESRLREVLRGRDRMEPQARKAYRDLAYIVGEEQADRMIEAAVGSVRAATGAYADPIPR